MYEIGSFPGYRWSEWNGKFRDDIRSFVKGDPGIVKNVALRISGSPDLYQENHHLPVSGINFVTCHDGFTLNDLVSYNEKHNIDNGEHNNDGINDNLSWNCGVEGPTNDPQIEQLRKQQIKNFLTLLMISQGVPMLLGGDEMQRTQNGNNNAYCQDSEISWFDWGLTEKSADMVRFCSSLINFRKQNHALHQGYRFFDGSLNNRGIKDIDWHGCILNEPGWDDPDARALACTIGGIGDEPDLHVMMNMYWEPLDFEIPVIDGRSWYKAIDTAASSPEDIVESGSEMAFIGEGCTVKGRSIVILISR